MWMINRVVGALAWASCLDLACRSAAPQSQEGALRTCRADAPKQSSAPVTFVFANGRFRSSTCRPGLLSTSKVKIGGLKHWLERNDDGVRLRHVIQQGGFGFSRLCEACNNRTGSWYAAELTEWVHAAVAAIHALPAVAEMDARLEDHSVMFHIEGVRPLAMAKQIITMVLVVNDVEFAVHHPDLRAFVLDRDRTGLQDVQIYLALYLGPIIRFVGISRRANLETSEAFVLSEVAYPPFSYIASFDEPPALLKAGNITGFAEIPYTTRATAEIELIVGFGHTPLPADFRTAEQVERDREQNAADA